MADSAIARIRRRLADEAGASLILVLALMIFSSLVIAATLTYSGTSLRSTLSTQARAQKAYDVDGALQAGINNIRNSPYAIGSDPCPGSPLLFPGPNLGQDVAVTCEGGPGTGKTAGVPIDTANRPAYSLLTLGDTDEVGINKTSTGTLRLTGPLFANSTIAMTATAASSVDPGAINVSGARAIARGACSGTGTLVSSPPAWCSVGGTAVADPAVAAPASYAQPSSGITYQPLPTCPGGGDTATFSPGYYDDAVGLSNMMDGGVSDCRVFWFQPGTYYFDFHNGEDFDANLPGTSKIWDISHQDVKVVAGATPSGSAPTSSATIPGSCKSPLSDQFNTGVQFVFGGDSQFQITAGQVEICGTYSADKPPIAIYGATSGTEITSEPTALNPSASANVAGSVDFANQSNIWGSGDATATVTTANPTARVRVTGYPGASVPAGSILTNAGLRVRHRETNTSGRLRELEAQITGAGGASLHTEAITTCNDSGTTCDYLTDVSADLRGALQDEVHSSGLANLAVTITADVQGGQNRNVTEAIDSVVLTLTWKPPTVRAQNALVNGGLTVNCIGNPPYTGTVGASCPLIRVVGGNALRLYVQGTTYAPLAPIDIALSGNSPNDAVKFLSGVIIRKLEVKIVVTASNTYNESGVEIPNNSLDVYFRAYTCPTGSTCSSPAPASPWTPAGTAKVAFVFVDSTDAAKASPRNVTVETWSISP